MTVSGCNWDCWPCWLRKLQPNKWASPKWVTCSTTGIYGSVVQREAGIIPLCSLFICSILKYSLSPTSAATLFTLALVVYSVPFLPPRLSILISFALSMVIYLPDLYLSTTNKLGYHAPPLPYSVSASPALARPFHQPPHPHQPWQLTYEMPCQSEEWCLPQRLCVRSGQRLCLGSVCVRILRVEELHSCRVAPRRRLLRPGLWQVKDTFVYVCVCLDICVTSRGNPIIDLIYHVNYIRNAHNACGYWMQLCLSGLFYSVCVWGCAIRQWTVATRASRDNVDLTFKLGWRQDWKAKNRCVQLECAKCNKL